MIAEIYKSLKENNPKIVDFRNSGENWILPFTILIKNIIIDIGRQKKYDYYISTNSFKNVDQGEWLFDISFQD